MAQVVSQSVPNGSGASVRSSMNGIFAALFSSSSGASAPSPTVAGMLWFDTGSVPAVLRRRNSANDGWDKVSPGISVTDRASGYTAVEADRYSLIRCTNEMTLAFDPATTLGNDWSTIIKADGGRVTLDPDGSETINGKTTETLENGAAAMVFSDGSVLHWIKISSGVKVAARNVLSDDGPYTTGSQTLSQFKEYLIEETVADSRLIVSFSAYLAPTLGDNDDAGQDMNVFCADGAGAVISDGGQALQHSGSLLKTNTGTGSNTSLYGPWHAPLPVLPQAAKIDLTPHGGSGMGWRILCQHAENYNCIAETSLLRLSYEEIANA